MLEIGTIDSIHGLKGEVIVNLLSNVPERLQGDSEVFIQKSSSQGNTEKAVILSARKHKKKFIVSFQGVETRELAEELRGSTLFAEPLEADESAEGNNLWLHQLVGCEVIDQDGKNHGKVSALEVNPASDLLVLESGALVPAVFIESHTLNDSKEADSKEADSKEGEFKEGESKEGGPISGIIKITAPEGLL